MHSLPQMKETSLTSTASKTRRPSTAGTAAVAELRFGAVRAVQAGRAYFVTACPLGLVPQILTFDSADLPPELRAQRVLNKSRVPQIARYLSANPTSYVLSALTASIDGDVQFNPSSPLEHGVRTGELVVPGDARILVNDGQHRRAAIEEALKVAPQLAHESVPLVLFLDAGLRRSQQIFADLNRHDIRPPRSLNVLYDHRDWIAALARRVVSEVSPFAGLTELEKSSLSNRSSKMFTLSAIHQATKALLRSRRHEQLGPGDEQLALEFWQITGQLIQGWGFITEGRTAADLRDEYIHVHAIALHAVGTVAGDLAAQHPQQWQKRLRRLAKLDWSRSNPIWDGRAIRNGRISTSGPSLILTTNILRDRTRLALDPAGAALEATLFPEDRRVAA
jgi:DNA sulfur modification protein DndB